MNELAGSCQGNYLQWQLSASGERAHVKVKLVFVRNYLQGNYLQWQLLDEMRSSGILPNRVVYNTLISSFCKEGKTGDAEKLVEKMREDGLFPDVVIFNARISALCSAGKVLEASRIFRDM